MSSTLVWRLKKSGGSLPDQLKLLIRNRYALPKTFRWGSAEVEYLAGLVDGKVKGALELCSLVEEHCEIEVSEEE